MALKLPGATAETPPLAQLMEMVRMYENTVVALQKAVSRFLTERGVLKAGDPLPMGDGLYRALTIAASCPAPEDVHRETSGEADARTS